MRSLRLSVATTVEGTVGHFPLGEWLHAALRTDQRARSTMAVVLPTASYSVRASGLLGSVLEAQPTFALETLEAEGWEEVPNGRFTLSRRSVDENEGTVTLLLSGVGYSLGGLRLRGGGFTEANGQWTSTGDPRGVLASEAALHGLTVEVDEAVYDLGDYLPAATVAPGASLEDFLQRIEELGGLRREWRGEELFLFFGPRLVLGSALTKLPSPAGSLTLSLSREEVFELPTVAALSYFDTAAGGHRVEALELDESGYGPSRERLLSLPSTVTSAAGAVAYGEEWLRGPGGEALWSLPGAVRAKASVRVEDSSLSVLQEATPGRSLLVEGVGPLEVRSLEVSLREGELLASLSLGVPQSSPVEVLAGRVRRASH